MFGIFGLYQTKYMYWYVQYLYWYTIKFIFGSKFSVSFGVIPIIRSAKKIFLSDRRYTVDEIVGSSFYFSEWAFVTVLCPSSVSALVL